MRFLTMFISISTILITTNCTSREPNSQSVNANQQGIVEKNATGYQVLPKEAFADSIKNSDWQIIDVRTAAEFEAGAIEGAINIDVIQLDAFKEEVSKLDKAKPIAVYCKVGGRSQNAGLILANELDFQYVYDLEGGYKNWTQD